MKPEKVILPMVYDRTGIEAHLGEEGLERYDLYRSQGMDHIPALQLAEKDMFAPWY